MTKTIMIFTNDLIFSFAVETANLFEYNLHNLFLSIPRMYSMPFPTG